jgi:hypothetical protein
MTVSNQKAPAWICRACGRIECLSVVQKLSGNPAWEAAFEEVFNIALSGSAGPEKWAVSRWTSGRHEQTLALWVSMQRTLHHQKLMTPADVQRFEVRFLGLMRGLWGKHLKLLRDFRLASPTNDRPTWFNN